MVENKDRIFSCNHHLTTTEHNKLESLHISSTSVRKIQGQEPKTNKELFSSWFKIYTAPANIIIAPALAINTQGSLSLPCNIINLDKAVIAINKSQVAILQAPPQF